jgi:hypothetical protein
MNRHECLHNHSREMTESHDFDYWTSQRCGFGCGYSQGDLIDELEKEITHLKSLLAQAKPIIEMVDRQTQLDGVESWMDKWLKEVEEVVK